MPTRRAYGRTRTGTRAWTGARRAVGCDQHPPGGDLAQIRALLARRFRLVAASGEERPNRRPARLGIEAVPREERVRALPTCPRIGHAIECPRMPLEDAARGVVVRPDTAVCGPGRAPLDE